MDDSENVVTERALLTASATTLAAWIREGRVRSRHVCEVHVAHLRRCNPTLNALVGERFTTALEEADAADAYQGPADERPPLLGVPCTIKEAFQLEGMPNSGGLLARRSARAEVDAPTVARLREAGAIPLGVSNVSELCMWMESANRVYGRTSNPYDPERTAGGSSGGEAALVGAGASPFGLGSDIGGSIRMPAFFCGVFGHKASSGVVPNVGQYPHPERAVMPCLSTGPLCRRAEDLFPLLQILAGPVEAPEDIARDVDLRDPAAVDLARLRVITVPDNGALAVSGELRRVQRCAANRLRDRGATVSELALPELSRSLEVWSARVGEGDEESFAEMMGQGAAVSPGRELVRWLAGTSAHTLPAIGLAGLERLSGLADGRMREARDVGDALAGRLERLLGDDGVLLYPSYPRVAPRHRVPLLFAFHFVYTAIFNALELPVTQVPLGLDRGLPVGIQVVAAHGRDHLTLAVARELERSFGGWVPPPRWFPRGL